MLNNRLDPRLAGTAPLHKDLNRANVVEVFTVYGLPFFSLNGQALPVPKHYKDGVVDPLNPVFGSPRTVLNPRQFQFSAKFTF